MLCENEVSRICSPLVIGGKEILEATAGIIGREVRLRELSSAGAASSGNGEVAFLNPAGCKSRPAWGKVDAQAGIDSMRYIEQAVQCALKGEVDAIVTAPIHKVALKLGKVPYLDHTEALKRLTSSAKAMTLFVTGKLRIFFYSRHIAFKDVSAALDQKKLVECLIDCAGYLKRFGISSPHLALAALNPHGGDGGLFSDEEMLILNPAVTAANKCGIKVSGPVPADAVFHQACEGIYDAVLALYHDQGHIAAKTLDFYGTVSMTLGLPFLRTSVDHGTAMDIAGKGVANARSMLEAIKLAAEFALRMKGGD